MKYLVLAMVFAAGYLVANVAAPTANSADPKAPVAPAVSAQVAPVNPNIDIDGYAKLMQEAARHRATRRLTEADFIKMSKEEGVIVLDARSKEKYDMLHVKGAVNLSFPDIDIASLKKNLPNKDAKILIYCNNNFVDGPVAVNQIADNKTPNGGVPVAPVLRQPFPSKSPVASLNISTYISLYSYGYKNVYELGPQLDPKTSKITFASNAK